MPQRSISDLEHVLTHIVDVAVPCPTKVASWPKTWVGHRTRGPRRHFAPQAVAHGYQSLLSSQLSTNGRTRPALNL